MRTKGTCCTVTCTARMTSNLHDSLKLLSLRAKEVALRSNSVPTDVSFGHH